MKQGPIISWNILVVVKPMVSDGKIDIDIKQFRITVPCGKTTQRTAIGVVQINFFNRVDM